MQTYTDSSELLKEGHKKVMCVSHCELVKTKPHRIPKGILGRLLKPPLTARSEVNRDILSVKSQPPSIERENTK